MHPVGPSNLRILFIRCQAFQHDLEFLLGSVILLALLLLAMAFSSFEGENTTLRLFVN